MKQIRNIFLAAASIAALFACNKEIEVPEEIKQDVNYVTVSFNAETAPVTKVSLTPNAGDTQFSPAWVENDGMAVEYIYDDGEDIGEGTVPATFNGTKFDMTLPDKTGEWAYTAFYPAKTAIPFGAARTQAGDAFNGAYDIMNGSLSVPSGAPGKDGNGNDIVIPMDRFTAIQYFHFTSDIDEPLVSATLTVDDGADPIAAETLAFSGSSPVVLAPETGSATSKSITLSFTGTTNAQDFKLWFSVLPGGYNSMSLTIETTNYTKTITRSTSDTYVAGKLYKVSGVKLNNWTPKATYYRKITSTEGLMNGTYLIVYEGDATHDAAAFDGSLTELDVNNNGIAVTISNDAIESTSTLDASAFTISIDDGSVISANGKYIGATSYANRLDVSDSAGSDYINGITIDSGGNALITVTTAGGDVTLKYNYASNTLRFRYYKSGQQDIALYLKDGTGTAPAGSKLPADLSYASASVDYDIDSTDPFVEPTLSNPNNLTVTYASSNTSVATIVASGENAGKVSIIGTGVTTITASTLGNDTYAAGEATYTLTVTTSNIEEVTVAQFLAKEVGDTWYKLTGKITNVTNTSYGNFTLVDATGSVSVYGLTATQVSSNDQSYASLGLKERDIVTLIAQRSEYNSSAQTGGPAYYVSHVSAAEVSVSPESKTILASDTEVNITVTSNCAWTITGSGFTASPATGVSGETAVSLTVPARTVTGEATITATVTADDDDEATAAITITQKGTDYVQPTGWIETDIVDITSEDVFAIVANETYALPHDGSSAPVLVPVTVSNSKISGTVPSNIQWNLSGNSSDGYTFYPNGNNAKYLRCSTQSDSGSNDNIRISTGTRNVFIIDSGNHIVTKDSYVARYIGINGTSNFRGYVTATSGTEAIFKFYKFFDDGKKDADISYSPSSATIIYGESLTQPTLTNNSGITGITYGSSDDDIATVTNTGVISVVKPGSATITASWAEQTVGANKYREGSATFTLTINKATPTVEFDSSNLNDAVAINGTVTNLATITPNTLSVTYSSSNTNVATVNETSGLVTGKDNGTAIITASFAGNDYYNSASDTYTITVGTGNNNAKTYSLTPNQASTGSNSTSYITTLTQFTYSGITWKMNQWNPSTLQIKTNQSSAASEFRFYNTSAFPGRITSVVITFSSLTVSDSSGFKFVGGTSEVSTTTGGTAGTWNATDKTLTWTPGASDNFTYFAFYQNGKVATGTNKLAEADAIVVTYE